MSPTVVEPNTFIKYRTMCDFAYGAHLTKGMNFRIRGNRTVVLMSTRDNAPYADRASDDGKTLRYVGHNQPRNVSTPNPGVVDQMLDTPAGGRTENGKFWDAVGSYRAGGDAPESVFVFEKIRKGIWVFSGVFELVGARRVHDGTRFVFEFELRMTDEVLVLDGAVGVTPTLSAQRAIPSHVKQAVFARDRGRCVMCGATDNLHFDHVLPYSKGGTSLKEENVQLLCARHNLQKRDRIE